MDKITTLKEAGKKGGLKKKASTDKTKYELAVELSALVTHKSELIEMLHNRSVPWLRAKIAELKKDERNE